MRLTTTAQQAMTVGRKVGGFAVSLLGYLTLLFAVYWAAEAMGPDEEGASVSASQRNESPPLSGPGEY